MRSVARIFIDRGQRSSFLWFRVGFCLDLVVPGAMDKVFLSGGMFFQLGF